LELLLLRRGQILRLPSDSQCFLVYCVQPCRSGSSHAQTLLSSSMTKTSLSRDAVVLCRFWKIYHQGERIATLAKAENVKMDSYWPPLFAKLLEKKNVDDLERRISFCLNGFR
ncbi:unnamed protein product, partial [Musa acuminata var. zebrina]